MGVLRLHFWFWSSCFFDFASLVFVYGVFFCASVFFLCLVVTAVANLPPVAGLCKHILGFVGFGVLVFVFLAAAMLFGFLCFCFWFPRFCVALVLRQVCISVHLFGSCVRISGFGLRASFDFVVVSGLFVLGSHRSG